MGKIGFDNDRYIETQSAHIRERIGQFGGKLYLEFGGKLFDDFHASRVLPGFAPDSKIRMLQTLKEDVEILVTISAVDIEKNKIRGDLGIPYEEDVLRLIDIFRSLELYVGSIQIQKAAVWPAFARSPNPRQREIKLEPPSPNRLANAVKNIKQGMARVAAATWSGSPSCPMKKVSAIL